MRFTIVQAALLFGVAGTTAAVAVPAFVHNLSASKLTEVTEGLDRLVTNAVAHAETHPYDISFPPPAPLTPPEVPRGVRAKDPPDVWEHLTWLSLKFRFTEPHMFAFKWDSKFDESTGVFWFVATAHGDLDGDGQLSTFEVRGDRRAGEHARVLPGMYVEREVE